MDNDIFELADLDAKINNEPNHFKKGELIRSTFEEWELEEYYAIEDDQYKLWTDMDKRDSIDIINGDYDDGIPQDN